MNSITYIIFSLGAFYLLFSFVNFHWKSSLLIIASRWIRWILFSVLITFFIRQWNISEHPFIILTTIFFLGWFLVESILMWLNIKSLNHSSIAIFPRFVINTLEAKWPNLHRFVRIKEFLRTNGFKEIQSIKTNTPNTLPLNIIVYKDNLEKCFLQLIFIPQRKAIPEIYFSFLSITENDKRYITDNLDMPLGGFMPEGWFKIRKPLCNSIQLLYKYHLKRLSKSKENFIPWQALPLEEYNYQQRVLEHYNITKGFLNHPNFHANFGKLTAEGCFRIWKQFWFLKYIGISIN